MTTVRWIPTYLRSRKSFNLPRPELEELQMRKLRATLSFACANVPFYKDAFRRMGSTPEDIRTVSDLLRLPAVSKADVFKMQQSAESGGQLKGMKFVTSTGTTGEVIPLARGGDRSVINRSLTVRTWMQWRFRPWSRVATLWAPQKYWKKQVLPDGSSRPFTGAYKYPLWLFTGVTRNLLTLWVDPSDPAKDAATLGRFRPEFVYSRPSYLRRISHHGGEGFDVKPRVIVAAGEIMTATGYRELRDAYGAKVVRSYGSSDVGKLGADCLYQTGIHGWDDFMVYEVLKHDEPVSAGEVGELVVTVLCKEVVPRIRFRTGDYVKVAEAGRCECGSSTTRFSSIEGRDRDCIIGAAGERHLATDVADHLESAFGLRDFQLVQTGFTEFTLLLRPDQDALADEVSGVRSYLGELAGGPIDLQTGARSEEDYWVKTRPVVCKLAELPLAS